MSAKRPRPAIPVLVHVDNPAEVGSVTVDVSTIEGKMDTVITNQNRIYDKIPTSGGGSSADLTTVNQKITTLAAAVGPANSGTGDRNLIGHVINLVGSIGDFNAASTPSGGTVKSYLSNIRNAIGNSTIDPTATETTVRGLLTAIKENTASGGGGSSADLTTVNEKITALAETVGPLNSTYEIGNLLGRVKNISRSVGDYNVPLSLTDTDLRSLLYNVREAIGYSSTSPTTSGTSIRNKLATIDTNTTTVKNTIGTLNSSSKDTDLIGCVRNLRVAVGASGSQLLPTGDSVRSFLFNLCKAVGNSYDTPTSTENTVRGLLTAIKDNTASGSGGGGSADLTTVNEKTTALAAAIGSASDDSSTASVIGLLKSITDKY